MLSGGIEKRPATRYARYNTVYLTSSLAISSSHLNLRIQVWYQIKTCTSYSP